jgi:drug/metabolite transporter (DMT)-like permease
MTGPPALSARAWGLLVLLALLWGGTFLFVGVAVREWPPLAIVFARVALAALALWAMVAAWRLPLRRDGAALMAHLGMGVLNNLLPFLLIVWAQGSLAAGAASIFNATTPLWAVLLAHLAGAERATPRRLAGVLTGFAGVAVMAGVNPLESPPAAVAAMLAATFCYGLAGLWGRRFKALGIPPLVAAAGQTSAATLLLLPALLVLAPPLALPAPSLATAASLVALALLSTALAYRLYFRILDLAGPVNLLLVTLIIPVFAAAFGALLLGERLGAEHAAGMGLIAAGLALIDGRLLRRR